MLMMIMWFALVLFLVIYLITNRSSERPQSTTEPYGSPGIDTPYGSVDPTGLVTDEPIGSPFNLKGGAKM